MIRMRDPRLTTRFLGIDDSQQTRLHVMYSSITACWDSERRITLRRPIAQLNLRPYTEAIRVMSWVT